MTKQKQAEQIIRKWLNDGKYPPGSKLPSLLEISSELGFTTQPIRKAIEILVKEKQLYCKSGVGIFACDSSHLLKKIFILMPFPLDHNKTPIMEFLIWKVYEGILHTCQELSWENEVIFYQNAKFDISKLLKKFKEDSYSGIVVMGDFPEQKLFQLAAKIGAWRIVSAQYADFPNHLNRIGLDIKPGIFSVLEKALEKGHRNFAMFYGSNLTTHWSHLERYRIFSEFCQKNHIHVSPSCMISTGGSAMDGYRATMSLLKSEKNVTLIFAATDERAKGILWALSDKGLQPGKDISVIGYDDMPDAKDMNLTTVKVPRYEIGQKAVMLLDETLKNREECQCVLMKTEAVFRKSLGVVGKTN